MPNKFLILLDQLLWKINKIAKWCKSLNEKFFNTFFVTIVCCSIVSFLGTDTLKNIPVIKSAYYDTIVANYPQFVAFLSANIGKYLFFVLLILSIFCLLFRKIYRPVALLISHSTMGYDLSSVEQSFEKSFWFIKRRIESQAVLQNASKEKVVEAICKQDDFFKRLNAENWCSTVFYYGVAHTPLVFRFGYQWGQSKTIRFLHRFRPTENEQTFNELPIYVEEKTSFLRSDRFDVDNYNLHSKDLLVSLATTYAIKDTDLSSIDPSNSMLRYKIEVDMLGYDFFNSYQKIHSYADRIVSDLREFVKEREIETIHIVISSSVPFTFYLAQQMNTNQFCKIIVYHYDHGRYTWGIDITELNAEKAVKWI